MNLRPGVVYLLCLTLLATPAAAALNVQQVSDSQREAQARREALQQRIRNVQQELELREAERRDAADALRQSEQALSRIARRLHELAVQTEQQHAEQSRLTREIDSAQQGLMRRREALAAQLREQYVNELSPWSIWLSGGDPQGNGRNLVYLDYIARARAQAVRALDAEVARLAALQAEQRAGGERLAALQRDVEAQRREQAAQQRERAAVLARLEDRIRAQRVEASRLNRDDERLGRLVEDLGLQLVAARRESEARRQAELRRQEEARQARARLNAERLAREQAARQAAAERAAQLALEREQAKRNEVVAPTGPVGSLRQVEGQRLSAAGEAPASTPAPVTMAPQEPVQTLDVRPVDTPVEPVAAAAVEPAVTPPPRAGGQGAAGLSNGLRSGLRPPLVGRLLARYGTEKPDGGVWRGQLIAAPEGTAVRVIESGTVVYANWLRGFGNIIIVDHGRDYLSVYAHNQSLLKQVGDEVARQEAIALAGATGGQLDSGLYFEVRHRGTPVDPARFIAR